MTEYHILLENGYSYQIEATRSQYDHTKQTLQLYINHDLVAWFYNVTSVVDMTAAGNDFRAWRGPTNPAFP